MMRIVLLSSNNSTDIITYTNYPLKHHSHTTNDQLPKVPKLMYTQPLLFFKSEITEYEPAVFL